MKERRWGSKQAKNLDQSIRKCAIPAQVDNTTERSLDQLPFVT